MKISGRQLIQILVVASVIGFLVGVFGTAGRIFVIELRDFTRHLLRAEYVHKPMGQEYLENLETIDAVRQIRDEGKP